MELDEIYDNIKIDVIDSNFEIFEGCTLDRKGVIYYQNEEDPYAKVH